MLFRILVFILFIINTNGIEVGKPCMYESSLCNFGFIGEECVSGSKCTYSGKSSWLCGKKYICSVGGTLEPTPKPTAEPTQAIKKEGDICDTIELVPGSDCDTLHGSVFECEDDLECGGSVEQECGTYKYCRVPLTPKPTPAPVEKASLFDLCCPDPPIAACGNRPQCGGNTVCIGRRVLFSTRYECLIPPPTPKPTPLPTPKPTPLPTHYSAEIGEMCANCNTGEEFHNSCVEGSYCIPNDVKQCMWTCQEPQALPGSSINDNNPVVVNDIGRNGMYTRILYYDYKYIVAANPSESKVDIYFGSQLKQTLTQSSSSNFGTSIAVSGEWLFVGAPGVSGGAIYVYRSVVSGPEHYVSPISSITYLSNDGYSGCGKELVANGLHYFATCDSDQIVVGVRYTEIVQKWKAMTTVEKKYDEMTNFGKSISLADNFLAIGYDTGVMIVNVQKYIVEGKTEFYAPFTQYFSIILPKKPDTRFGHSVVLNYEDKYMLVGTGTNKIYHFDWNRARFVTNEQISVYDVPSHDIVFEPYVFNDMSFARTKSKALIFKDGHFVSSEWGPPFDSYTIFDKPVLIAPINSQKFAYARDDKITSVDTAVTSRPTVAPTNFPTESPTLAPTREPYFDYAVRNGRSCGLSSSHIKTIFVSSSDECEKECTRIEDCRCFDFTTGTRSSCSFYSTYDSDITWNAGRTHSYVKISDKVLNVVLNVYVINSDGEVVSGKDIRSYYDVDIANIKVHTTEGQVGMIWNYVPEQYSPPANTGLQKIIPILSNNPYPQHPVTYDGYISIIGSKLLMIDYDFRFIRDVSSQNDASFIVTATVREDDGRIIYYNSHQYVKETEKIECETGGVPYSVGQETFHTCPAGMIHEQDLDNDEYFKGYKCATFWPELQELAGGKYGYVYYYNDGFNYPDFEWDHCSYYNTPNDRAKERRVSVKSLVNKRAESKSQFVFSPDVHRTMWERFGSEDIPDPADTPVKLRIYNFQDASPLVISDIVLRDKSGRKIREVSASEIVFLGGDTNRQYTSDDVQTYSCPYAGTSLISSCKDFDYGPCCGTNPTYKEHTTSSCSGSIIGQESIDGDVNQWYKCKDKCNDDIDCVGYTARSNYNSRTNSFYTSCVYYSSVSKQKKCNDCSSQKQESCFVAPIKSTRVKAKIALVKAYNDVTEKVYGCNTDRSEVYISLTGNNVGALCPWYMDKDDEYISSKLGYYKPPITTTVNSRAFFEIEIDGHDVEYVDIGVGAIDGSDQPSSYYYRLFHHGLKINDGVFYKSNLESNRRSIHINNAGDNDVNDIFGKTYKNSAMTLYTLLCNDEIGEEWYNSHTIITILNYGGITVEELCRDMDSAFQTRNPAIFNDIAFLFQTELDQTLEEFSNTFLDGTYKSFIAYETSNSEFPATVESVTSAIEFLISINKMFDCTNTTDPELLENFDSAFLAESLLLEHRYPTRYKSWCDNLKSSEDMWYEGRKYNIGREGAPCISNAMCADHLVCADYYCTTLNGTESSICEAGSATIHPLYYGLKPPAEDSYGCSHNVVYSNNGFGAYDFQKGSSPYPQSFGSVSTNEKIEYDNFMSKKCSAYNWVTVALDHFRRRGNFQGCHNFYTSEIVDAGTGIQLSEDGRDSCSNDGFNDRIDTAWAHRGEYDRLVPRKMSSNNMDILNKYELGDHKQLPTSFALENGHEITLLADMLDGQCLYPNLDDLSFSGKGVVNEISCKDIKGCVWSDSLRQCVASRENIEANFCPLVQDEDQCKFTGFCLWNDHDDSCYHATSADLEYDPSRNKENQCEIIFDPISCGKASCIWDMVQQSCFASWDKVTQLHDSMTLSAIQGSSNSLNHLEVKIKPNGETKVLDSNKWWPACSTPGKMDKGQQLSGGKWTYYPSPGQEMLLGGYEQNDNVGVGMRWESRRRTETISITTKKYEISWTVWYWRQPSVENFVSTTNKICFKKHDLYNKEMCEGYGFRWNAFNKICIFSDDGTFHTVNELIPIAVPIVYWDVTGGYNWFNSPDQYTWDEMVNEHFDNNDHENIKVHDGVSYHGYQFVRFGCYTRITKDHCENRDGLNQIKYIYGVKYHKPDSACLWLPLIDKCVARSDKYNIYRSVFQMPTNPIAYNSTIGSLAHLSTTIRNVELGTSDIESTKSCSLYYNKNDCLMYKNCMWGFQDYRRCLPYKRVRMTSFDDIDTGMLHWDSQFNKNYNPVQAEELVENLNLCKEHLVYDECVMNEGCHWDFESWECKVSLCNVMQLLTPDATLKRMTGNLKDLRETTVRAKTCERMIGCSLDPITHTCGPTKTQNFYECPADYTMVNSYMDAKICPKDKVVVGNHCVDPKNVWCPWGITDYYQPSYMDDYDFRKPDFKNPVFGDPYFELRDDSKIENWQGDGTEFPKIKSSMCKHPDDTTWSKAKLWKKDQSLHDDQMYDQGITNKCLAHGKPDVEPTPTREHVDGEFSSANRAFCAALKQQYGFCNVHIKGKDFVCVDIKGDCSLRYPSIESISLKNIDKYITEVIFSPDDDTQVDWQLLEIFNYVDTEFDINADAFFTMYFTEADLYLIDGLKENVLTSEQLEQRFGQYYMDEYYKELSGYIGFNNESNWPKYEPDYRTITIPTLDFSALSMEMIGKFIIDPKKDLQRSVFAEVYTDTYLKWREIQLAAIDEHIDNDLLIIAATETSQLRDMFWDQHEYLSNVYNYIWASTFESDDAYDRHINDLMDSSAPSEWGKERGIENLAKAYLFGETAEMYFESERQNMLNTVVDEVDSVYNSGDFMYYYHYTHSIIGWAQYIDDVLDTKLINTRYEFNYDTTVEIIDRLFGGGWARETQVLEKHRWPDVIIKRPPASIDVLRSKVVKKVSTLVPYHRRTHIVRNHVELGVQKLWRRLPAKPPTAPSAPKIIDSIPLPQELKPDKFRKVSKIPQDVFDSYVSEYFKKMKGKMVHKWIPNGAIKSHHVVMNSKFKTGFKLHEVRKKAQKLSLRETVTIKKQILRNLNAKKKGSYVANMVRIKVAREKLVESIRLRNQLIGIVNNAQLLDHNLKVDKFNKIMGAWSDSAKVYQRPNVRVSQTVDTTTTSGLVVVKSRLTKSIASLSLTKQPASVALQAKATAKILKITKVWKSSKVGRILKFSGKFFKPFMSFMNVIDTALTVMDIFNTIKFTLENPAGCSRLDSFIGIPNEPMDVVQNIFNGPKMALRFRALLFQDLDNVRKEMRCAERMSWGMHNADGRYGIVDYRYLVPECGRSFNYRQLDYHFSNDIKGLNRQCEYDSDCNDISSTGKCVYNRCVFNAHYVGMKQCKLKSVVDTIFLDEPLTRMKYLNTDYDTFNMLGVADPPNKYVHSDEMLFGKNLLNLCGGNTRFAEYTFNKHEPDGNTYVTCFDECKQWTKNVDHDTETWMLTMTPSVMRDGVNDYCNDSTECTNGGICSSDHKCTPPITCLSHRHCYGGYYLTGRLPRCDCETFTCVDDTPSTCTNIDDCEVEAMSICEMPDETPKPTPTPTNSPVTPTKRPTTSPTISPTKSPTDIVTLPPVFTFNPTLSPTLNPTLSPTTSAPTLAPVTDSPTKSPTIPGPFAGSECDFDMTEFYVCRGEDNLLYMSDIDSHEEILEETEDYSTCESACRNTIECMYFYVETLIDRQLKCVYYSGPGSNITFPGIAPRPGPNVIGCFEKQIPCVPTASPTFVPTDSPVTVPTTIAPTNSPTPAPTINVSEFNLECEYGQLSETKLDDYDQYQVILQVDTELQCMEVCDTDHVCKGFQYELIARKCILYSEIYSNIIYSRASIFQKTSLCPFTSAPTMAPTAYVVQYPNVSDVCHYEEMNNLQFEITGPIMTMSNSSVHECVEYCDKIEACALVGIKHGNITSCKLYSRPQTVYFTDFDTGITWFNKTEDYCVKTPAPTAMPDWCNFTITYNSTFSEFTVDDVATDINDIFNCQKACNERSACNGYIFNSTSCVFISDYNETSIIASNDTEIHLKETIGCVATLNPTVSPTDSPTLEEIEFVVPEQTQAPTTPTNSPTNSPTASPTITPTNSPTETITCNYARLPGFGPRADALYVIQHESHNTTVSHTERSCLLSCDRIDRCVAFTHNSNSMSCTFYDILGPIELKTPDPVVLNVKSKTCTIPHVLDDEGTGGCEYTERPEQFVENGIFAIAKNNLTNASNVLDCSVECDHDGSCKMFDYNTVTLTCKFYYAATQWGVDTYYGGYVKSDPYCVYDTPTINPTTAPTTSNTTNSTGPLLVIDPSTDKIPPAMIVLITLLVVMCCGICCVMCFKRRGDQYVIIGRRRIPQMYAIEGTIELDLDL